jgi:hypothetical protein
MRHVRSRRFHQAMTWAAVFLTSCVTPPASETPGDPDAARQGAYEMFWSTFHGNDYAQIWQAQAALRDAITLNPDNGQLHALLAATHFWHAGEANRDPHPDPQVLRQDLPEAIRLFRRAAELDPEDDRLPGFIGVTISHAGFRSGDANLIAQADRILDYAVYQFPEFNNFNLWAAHNHEPRDSDGFRRALDALWSALDLCLNGHVDRENPDVTPYLALRTATGRKKVCWDQNALAPHSFEGFMLGLGNGLVKANSVAAARVAYANAKLARDYASWPYRTQLESLLAADLGARAALYADSDPSNDPPVTAAGSGCTYCHARVPPP